MALTRVAPAGIGSTPGTGYVIGDSFLHSRGLNAIDANYTGIVTAQSIRVIGDLQVDGTTTTLDTAVTEVDKLEVGANNNTVGVAITQSGTGDILNLYDGSTQVVTVEDGGRVGIGTQNPTGILDVHKGSSTAYDSTDDNAQRADSASITIRNDNGSTNTFSQLVFDTGGSNQSIARIVAIRSGTASNHLAFVTEHSNTKAERLRIDSNGRLSLNDNSRPASDASEGAQLRVTGTPLTRNQYYSPTGDYFGSFGYTDNTYTKSWISVDSSYNKASAVSSGIFLSSFHADAGSSPCGHTIKNERTDAGGLIFSSVATAASVNNPAVETERLRIKTNGNIGIATDNPAQKLHIWGNSATTALSIGDNSLTEPYVLLEANATDNVSTLHSRGNHPLTFKIQQSEKVRIQNDGKVGIGTVSPTDKLSVYGGTASVWNTNTNNRVWSVGTTNGHGLMKAFRSDAEVFFRVDSDAKKVGIGTDNPDATLKVNVASGNNGVVVQNTSTANIALFGARNGDATIQVGQWGSTASGTTFGLSNANLAFIYTTTYSTTHPSALALGTVSNKPIVFATNNTERLRITDAGKVGIGTDDPKQFLAVVGRATFDQAGDYYGAWINGNSDADSSFNVGAWYNVGGRLRDNGNHVVLESMNTSHYVQLQPSGGNVGVGEDGPNVSLHVTKDNDVSYTPDQATQNSNNQIKIENHSTTADSFVSMAMRSRACDFHLGVKNDGDTNAGRLFLVHQDTTNKEVVSVTSAGKVGINESNPDQALHVKGILGDTVPARIESTGTQSRLGFQASGSPTSYHVSCGAEANDFLVHTNNIERLRITSDGQVVINRSSGAVLANTSSKLEVYNSTENLIFVSNSTAATGQDAGIMFGPANNVYGGKIIVTSDEDFSTSANRTAHMAFHTRNDGTASERLRIAADGDVRIGDYNTVNRNAGLSINKNDARLLEMRVGSGTDSNYVKRYAYQFIRSTSENTVNLLSLGSVSGNSHVVIEIKMYAVCAVQDQAAIITAYANARQVNNGSYTYGVQTPTAQFIIGTGIAVGSLQWTNGVLQYNTDANNNYTKYNTEITVWAHDRMDVGFY